MNLTTSPENGLLQPTDPTGCWVFLPLSVAFVAFVPLLTAAVAWLALIPFRLAVVTGQQKADAIPSLDFARPALEILALVLIVASLTAAAMLTRPANFVRSVDQRNVVIHIVGIARRAADHFRSPELLVVGIILAVGSVVAGFLSVRMLLNVDRQDYPFACVFAASLTVVSALPWVTGGAAVLWRAFDGSNPSNVK